LTSPIREIRLSYVVLLLHEHLGVGGITAFVLILLGSWLATRGAASAHGAGAGASAQ